ncbi:caspase-7 [Astyanax mexicanus]|uniref:caspase-7 n=1 Tax=Astyanax mexicanus TaxID=7994 RepID=UPI0020CABDBE|nr:caspase-7 [Astyanax mexicanus]
METLRGNKVFLIDTLSVDSERLLQFAEQNEIITDRDYRNLNHPNHTDEKKITNLLDMVRGKGEETSDKFVELLKNKDVQKTFPNLKKRFTPAPLVTQQDGRATPSNEMGEYTMSKIPRGDCVIINNMDFEENNKKNVKPQLQYRTGSDKDKESLEEVFTWLGFTVEVHTNKTAKQMKDILNKFGQKTHEGDCFVCCILSHGCAEGVYGTDGGVVSSEDIFSPFRGLICPSLAKKPKAFFIQACRGKDYQRLVEVQADNAESDKAEDEDDKELELDGEQITIPNDADFFVARSTVKGFYSIRNPQKGSWFIQSLCEQLKKFCPKGEGIQNILNCVNKEVSRCIAELKIDEKYVLVKQMPVQKGTLTKKLVFRITS